ncbi:hypothetical protein [Gordonia humi]|uniref:YVTN family beta-propeller protein n=1 Tax=Gordonia humi TaxID=686429 RepID=A0A840ETM3_9ACTN|nr:hypothetical protein [Gordonia humi]MBB4134921.1 YVTN family beta-propeller protein [Gordonia humi]
MTTERCELVVSNTMWQHLEFYDTETFEEVARIDDLIAQPHEMAFDHKRRLLYLTHTYRAGGYGEKGQEHAHELSVIDVDARKVVDVIDLRPYYGPHDVEFDVERDLIYTGVERVDGRNGVVVVDPETRTVVDSIPLEPNNSHWLGLTPDASRLFVAHKEGVQVSVVDLAAREVVGAIPVPHGTEEVDCSPDGRFAYVATPIMKVLNNVSQGAMNRLPAAEGDPPTQLLKIDAATHEIVGSIDFEGIVCAVRVAPDGSVMVSEMLFPEPDEEDPGEVPGQVHLIDADTMTRRFQVQAGELPFTIRFSPDGATAYVANLKSGTVTVVDVPARAVVHTIEQHVGAKMGGSHGMAVVPVSPHG